MQEGSRIEDFQTDDLAVLPIHEHHLGMHALWNVNGNADATGQQLLVSQIDVEAASASGSYVMRIGAWCPARSETALRFGYAEGSLPWRRTSSCCFAAHAPYLFRSRKARSWSMTSGRNVCMKPCPAPSMMLSWADGLMATR